METEWAVRIAVSSLARNGKVGMGGVVCLLLSMRGRPKDKTFARTLGPRTEQNLYSGELAAVGHALTFLQKVWHCRIILATSNRAAVLTLKNLRQQSGQQYIDEAYDAMKAVRNAGNTISIVWIPRSAENELLKIAKGKAKEATKPDAIRQAQEPGMRSTTLRIAWAKRLSRTSLPERVGRYSKRVDAALPGKHTRLLYDWLSRREAGVLAQLRTGMAKLNVYLYCIEAASLAKCACGQARETVDHFIFRCRRWDEYRTEMLQCTNTHRGNLSFYLGGKSPSDSKNWSPNMQAVRATIRFAIATGRLDDSRPQNGTD